MPSQPSSSGEPTSTPTATPAPSASGPAVSASPQPTPSEAPIAQIQPAVPIGDERLDDPALFDTIPVAVWSEFNEVMSIYIGGSGTVTCVPTPVSATIVSESQIDVVFEAPAAEQACTADLRIYGWDYALDGASMSQIAEVHVTGIAGEGVTVLPLDIAETV